MITHLKPKFILNFRFSSKAWTSLKRTEEAIQNWIYKDFTLTVFFENYNKKDKMEVSI